MEQTVCIEKSPIDKGGHQRLLMMTSLRCQGKGLSSVEMGLSPFTIFESYSSHTVARKQHSKIANVSFCSYMTTAKHHNLTYPKHNGFLTNSHNEQQHQKARLSYV
ncbi:hypothetical protein ETT66_08310 [Streptococcus pyogenes]|nr:hypothetical protein ETT66_08310 [Streptococcus pyogenes]